MAIIKLGDLTTFEGDASGSWLVMNDPTNTATYKVQREQLMNSFTALSASYALTASYLDNYVPPFPYTGSAAITGSLTTIGSVNVIGSEQINGRASVTGSLIISGTLELTGSLTVSASNFSIYGSGSAIPLFSVNGSTGTILSVYDELTGSLWSINDISGNSVFEALADSRIFLGNSQSRLLITTVKSTLAAIPNNIVYSNISTSSFNVVYYDYLIYSSSNWKVGELIAMWDGTTINTFESTKINVGTTGVAFSVTASSGNLILSASANTAGWITKVAIKAI